MIKTIISDLGRVIVDFDNEIFFKKMAYYCPFTQEKIKEITFKEFHLVEAFDRGELTPEGFYERVTHELQATIDYEKFFLIYEDVFSLKPTTVELMKELKGHYQLVLLSNTDVMRYDFIRKKFPEIMIFDEYVLSFEVGSIKPESRIFKVVLEQAGSLAEECVFIDDREENVEAAEKLGIKSVLFTPQTDLKVSLKELGVDFRKRL